MYPRIAFVSFLILASMAQRAGATTYSADCGANGSAAVVQNQVNVIGSTPNSVLQVTGTCVGDVRISRADRLTVAGLVTSGNVTVDSSIQAVLSSARISGQLSISNSRNTQISALTLNGWLSINSGSRVTASNLTAAPLTDSDGTHDPEIDCIGQSECTFAGLTLTGTGTARGTGGVGLLAASASRLTVTGATISGFDIGVQVWNNATGFLLPICTPINIQSNLTTGVYVADGGIVKIEGQSAADADASGCTGPINVVISGNGSYGVLADGGGNAYLYLTNIQNHSVDGLRVQHGSTVRVRSSTVGAATATGRSGRVVSGANLYFDEQSNGPAAGSTLAGPVCVIGNSSVDTSNSSTVVTTVNSCS